jgi:hypothetical protein
VREGERVERRERRGRRSWGRRSRIPVYICLIGFGREAREAKGK